MDNLKTYTEEDYQDAKEMEDKLELLEKFQNLVQLQKEQKQRCNE